jgi:hypothetical protein
LADLGGISDVSDGCTEYRQNTGAFPHNVVQDLHNIIHLVVMDGNIQPEDSSKGFL